MEVIFKLKKALLLYFFFCASKLTVSLGKEVSAICWGITKWVFMFCFCQGYGRRAFKIMWTTSIHLYQFIARPSFVAPQEILSRPLRDPHYNFRRMAKYCGKLDRRFFLNWNLVWLIQLLISFILKCGLQNWICLEMNLLGWKQILGTYLFTE